MADMSVSGSYTVTYNDSMGKPHFDGGLEKLSGQNHFKQIQSVPGNTNVKLMYYDAVIGTTTDTMYQPSSQQNMFTQSASSPSHGFSGGSSEDVHGDSSTTRTVRFAEGVKENDGTFTTSHLRQRSSTVLDTVLSLDPGLIGSVTDMAEAFSSHGVEMSGVTSDLNVSFGRLSHAASEHDLFATFTNELEDESPRTQDRMINEFLDELRDKFDSSHHTMSLLTQGQQRQLSTHDGAGLDKAISTQHTRSFSEPASMMNQSQLQEFDTNLSYATGGIEGTDRILSKAATLLQSQGLQDLLGMDEATSMLTTALDSGTSPNKKGVLPNALAGVLYGLIDANSANLGSRDEIIQYIDQNLGNMTDLVETTMEITHEQAQAMVVNAFIETSEMIDSMEDKGSDSLNSQYQLAKAAIYAQVKSHYGIS